jgi:hypothetical protein
VHPLHPPISDRASDAPAPRHLTSSYAGGWLRSGAKEATAPRAAGRVRTMSAAAACELPPPSLAGGAAPTSSLQLSLARSRVPPAACSANQPSDTSGSHTGHLGRVACMFRREERKEGGSCADACAAGVCGCGSPLPPGPAHAFAVSYHDAGTSFRHNSPHSSPAQQLNLVVVRAPGGTSPAHSLTHCGFLTLGNG